MTESQTRRLNELHALFPGARITVTRIPDTADQKQMRADWKGTHAMVIYIDSQRTEATAELFERLLEVQSTTFQLNFIRRQQLRRLEVLTGYPPEFCITNNPPEFPHAEKALTVRCGPIRCVTIISGVDPVSAESIAWESIHTQIQADYWQRLPGPITIS